MLEHTLDMAGSMIGTPYYLSPEVCLGQKYDFNSDMWMLGCCLFEICTGKKPFEAPSIPLLMKQISEVDKPPSIPESVDVLFAQIIKSLLIKKDRLTIK